MIKNYIVQSILAILAFSYTSCTPSRIILNDLRHKPGSLGYLHEQYADETADIALNVEVSQLPDDFYESRLRRTKTTVVPLVVFNYWSASYLYSTGARQINGNIVDFVKKNFAESADRQGLFKATVSSDAELSVYLQLDSLVAAGPYKTSGSLLFLPPFYSYSQSESAGPGTAYSKIHYTLKIGDEVVKSGTVENTQATRYFDKIRTVHKLRGDYNEYLTEALSATFQQNINTVIKDINDYIRRHHGAEVYKRLIPEPVIEAIPVPETKVVIYRRRKRQSEVSAKVNIKDGEAFDLEPNAYKVMKMKMEPFEACFGANCQTITPSLGKTTYIECDLRSDDSQPQAKVVPEKEGVYYVQQIKNLNGTIN